MTNPFARFVHTSPLASLSHDPLITLASNCIRDYFGPTVQLVADCLEARGGQTTLPQLVSTIESKSRPKVRSGERKHIIKTNKLRPMTSTGGPATSSIRASLLVLVQHSIVTVTKKTTTKTSTTTKGTTSSSSSSSRSAATASSTTTKTRTTYMYEFHPEQARLLPRYPRFVEYTKKALDETAATLVEQLLLKGRMSTVDAILATVDQLHQLKDAPRSEKYTHRQAVLESFRRLVGGGFIQEVKEIRDENDRDGTGGEMEFEGGGDHHGLLQPPAKKARFMESNNNNNDDDSTDDPAIVSLLQSGQYKMLRRDAVWRVNLRLFHDSIRAVALGWLVSERYGHKVQSAGSMVTAALKLAAHKQHAEGVTDYESRAMFSTESITRYLPKSVLQNLEKKHGGVISNLHKALVELSQFRNPQVVEEMEVADGQLENAKFRIAIPRLTQYLQDRIIHQVVLDSHGEVAARVCSILKANGQFEAEAIAEAAMVPAKDTREVLHRLYRSNYITLFNINQGKQHNPASMIYLWSLDKHRILKVVTDTVCTCLLNMRLRRQHEVEVGKDWIERAKEASATYENDNETDKINYNRFCQGLERIDNATLQLDETMMVLKDF